MAHKEQSCIAVFALFGINCSRSIGLIALWSRTLCTFVQLCICIPKLNSNISNFFFGISYGLYLQNIKTNEKILLTLTPEMALTRVDLPWATCPIVPMFCVAYLEIISGVNGVIASISNSSRF